MSFRLTERDVVPVRVGGRRELVSLPELLVRAHEIDGFEVSVPPAEAALWRVLYVLAARVSGLGDPERPLHGDGWHERRDEVWQRGRFAESAVRAYFDVYGDRFDLFDAERPWLQDPRLAVECEKPAGVNKLVWGRPAGQNQVWFAHHWEADAAPVSSEQAVWHLLAQLFYGPSGRCTSREVAGRREANCMGGPLRSAVSFHIVAGNLFESLVAGLCPMDRGDDDGPDVAPWEADALPDPLAVPHNPGGYAALVGRLQHAVLLVPDADETHVVDAQITWAARSNYPDFADPYLIYQLSKQGTVYARPADAQRAIFRDLDALLCESSGDPKVSRPLVMKAVLELATQSSETLARMRLRALGFDQDGQTRDKQWFAATTPACLGLLEEQNAQGAEAISRWRRAAERAGRNLEWALRQMWLALNDPREGAVARKDLKESPWTGRAAGVYWARAERVFWALVREGDMRRIGSEFTDTARDVFDEITDVPAALPRWEKARARSRGLIFAGGRAGGVGKRKDSHDATAAA